MNVISCTDTALQLMCKLLNCSFTIIYPEVNCFPPQDLLWCVVSIFNWILMSQPTFLFNLDFQSSTMNLPLANRMLPTCSHLVGGNWNLVSHCSAGNCLASHLALYSEKLHFLHHMLLYERFLLLNKTTNITWCCKLKNRLTVRGSGKQHISNK